MRLQRFGLTLVEVLVAVAIMAVLVGLLIPAVQKARGVAVRLASENRLKQIALATQNFASASGGRLPLIVGNNGRDDPVGVLYWTILPYLGIGHPGGGWPLIPLLVSPADPSLDDNRMFPGEEPDNSNKPLCSYPANAQVFKDRPNLPGSIPDGTSCTIGFAERYSKYCSRTMTAYNSQYLVPNGHRATFADRSIYPFPGYDPYPGYDDVYPVTRGGETTGSVPGKTFQTVPTLDACDPTVAQTPHASGMLVALMDGGVRTVAPGVAPAVYWSAVTPAGGEPSRYAW